MAQLKTALEAGLTSDVAKSKLLLQKVKGVAKSTDLQADGQAFKAGDLFKDDGELESTNYVEEYHRYVGDPAAPAKRTKSGRDGNETAWYSNKIRNGSDALKSLQESTDQAVKKDAAEVLAWLALRSYNGGNKNATLYPGKVLGTK